MDSFRNCVGRKRAGAGLRQQELATKVGISRQSLSTLESGGAVPSTALALRLSKALGCRVEELFWSEEVTDAVEAELGFVEPRLATQAQPPPPLDTRVLLGFIDERWVAHRLDPVADAAYILSADGLLKGKKPAKAARATPASPAATRAKVALLGDEHEARNTLLCAGCAPAFGILAARASRAKSHAIAEHDRVLWLERTSGSALELLARGQVHVAGAHLYDEASQDFNVPFVARMFPRDSVQLFNLARWEVGLVVAPGNPKHVRGVKDLTQPGVSFVRRQAGAAAQELIERLLRQADLPLAQVTKANLTAHGHNEVARLVATGAADVGVALGMMAQAHGLQFIPLAEERFDLALTKERAGDSRIVRLLETLSSRAFRREMECLGGHVTRDAGKLMAETVAHA